MLSYSNSNLLFEKNLFVNLTMYGLSRRARILTSVKTRSVSLCLFKIMSQLYNLPTMNVGFLFTCFEFLFA